jgi:hypothetical protein
MRKQLMLSFLMIFILGLSSCTVPDENSLYMTLNPGIDTIGIDKPFTDAGAKAQYGFKNVDVEVIENTVDITTIGTYRIVYHSIYLDYEKTIIRYVTVVDDISPVATLNPGVDTIFVGTTWIDAGIQTSDNSADPVTIGVLGIVNNMVAGEYTIIYEATDQSGNVTTVTRYVNVLPVE